MIPKYDVPNIPYELVAESKRKARKVWNREDLDLKDPCLGLCWDRPPEQNIPGVTGADRIRDPELDVRCQLEDIRRTIEHMEAGPAAGIPSVSHPGFNLIHYGTGPLATAFGAKWIVREDDQPFFEPAIHTPQEARAMRKPNLHKDGILPLVLDRIAYYNEATQGKVPLTPCDTAGPWSIATQIWHYEDILEAIQTDPDAVHSFLDLVTDCIIEWYTIQETKIWNWSGSHSSGSWPWCPRGAGIGDDCMVCVSPAMWEEFFLPYNDRLAREYGGICYHCCMCHENHLMTLTKSNHFMGFDADPKFNNFEKIEAALVAGKGVWSRVLGMPFHDISADQALEDTIGYIRRLKGKVGLFFCVPGKNKQDAIDKAKRLLNSI
jgi:hypothetical protein